MNSTDDHGITVCSDCGVAYQGLHRCDSNSDDSLHAAIMSAYYQFHPLEYDFPTMLIDQVLADPALRLAILDAMGLDVRPLWSSRFDDGTDKALLVRSRGEATDA